MKKKFLAALFLAAGLASFAFAQGWDYPPPPPPLYGPPPPAYNGSSWEHFSLYLSLNIPVPFQWLDGYYNSPYFGSGGSARMWGLGVGADISVYLTKVAGIHISADVFFPQSIEVSSQSALQAYKPRGWAECWGVSFFVGPSLALARTKRVLFAIAPGFHVATLLAEDRSLPLSASQLSFGVGASVEFAFSVTSRVFLRAAVDAIWDFWETSSDWMGLIYSNPEGINAWSIVPALGVGVKF